MYLVDVLKDSDWILGLDHLDGDWLDGIFAYNNDYVNDNVFSKHNMDGTNNKLIPIIEDEYYYIQTPVDILNGDEYGNMWDDDEDKFTEEELYQKAVEYVMDQYGCDVASAHRIIDVLRRWEWGKDNSDRYAEIFTILTGKHYVCGGFSGYSQGDYLELFYPSDMEDSAEYAAGVILGTGYEVQVVEVTETETIYYNIPDELDEMFVDKRYDSSYYEYITDDVAWKGKSEICRWLGLPENETYIRQDGEWE